MKIGLITSTARYKKSKYEQIKVREFYSPSPLFRGQLAYCEKRYDQTFVLSALHKIIGVNSFIEPHDQSLESLPLFEYELWKTEVLQAIYDIFPTGTEFYFLVGRKSRQIMKNLINKGYPCFTPVKGLSIGHQLKLYKQERS